MDNTWLTKEVYKQALEENRVFMTGHNHTQNGITEYNLYILNPTPEKQGMIPVRELSPYWSENKCTYWVTAWGISRPLEIILSVGATLGLGFHEIEQNWTFL